MRAEAFLQKYRVLEDALGERYSGRTLRHASVVMEYLQDAESQPIREKLDLMREMRNLLSHNADMDGEMIFEPSPGVMRAMDEAGIAPKRLRTVHGVECRAPKFVLLEGVKQGGVGLHWLPPLVLRNADGSFTEEWHRIYEY